MSLITPLPLHEISNYTELVLSYEENRNKTWQEWLSFDCTFDRAGKQGLVGLLNDKKGNKYIFKISQYINYLVQHESVVMKGLSKISGYCPHFCKLIGILSCPVNPECRKSGNPFEGGEKYNIEKEMLLCEYINNSHKLYNYIRAHDRVAEKVIYSSIKQVLMAISIAQNKKRFSHYDLHSNNIMMRKCNKDVVFLYVLDKENQFCVPTFGSYPVIIDFGFSYIQDMDDGPLWPSLAHTDVGFMSDRFDWVADPKLFLVTISGEIKEKYKSKKSNKFRRIVRNIFSPLNIDWDSGWDTKEKKGASDYVTQMLTSYNTTSKLFREYEHYCIDLLQSLIILPLQEQKYSNIEESYSALLTEWVKIENQITSSFHNLYVLKSVVDAARFVRAAYTHLSTRTAAIKEFKRQMHKKIDKIAKFCVLKKLNYEKLLCSLLVFARCVEGILYSVVSTIMLKKEREYKKLPLQSVLQIYGAIEANLPDNYVYTADTTIFIIDTIKESCDSYKIPENKLSIVNEIHNMARGTYIYDLVTESTDTRGVSPLMLP